MMASDPITSWQILLFSHSVVSDSLWLHGLQHTSPPCPSPPPRACSNSCPLSRSCHPTILSSVVPFSSCFQSFPASQSFPVSWLFTPGGQSIGVSASASVLPMNIQGWFPLGLTGFISLLFKRLSSVFSSTQFEGISSSLSFLYGPSLTSVHDYWKNHSFTIWTFVSKATSLLFKTKLCEPLPCFILYFKAKFAYYSRYFLTSYFYIPVLDNGFISMYDKIHYNKKKKKKEKYIFFCSKSSCRAS